MPVIKFRTFSAPKSNFRTFQVLQNENSNFRTFQDQWEPCTLYLSKQSIHVVNTNWVLYYCCLFSIWATRKNVWLSGIFSRTTAGPKWFSRTFQVLEFSRKKSRTFQDFQGGVGTLFVFWSLSGQAPPYLADDIHLVSEGPRRWLHSHAHITNFGDWQQICCRWATCVEQLPAAH